MPPVPRYRVVSSDGEVVGELYDLLGQGLVSLHIEDEELARFLEQRVLLTPPRPPFLDAHRGHGGAVHGSYAARPQVNWFLAPPLEDVAAALEAALGDAGGGYTIARAAEIAEPSATVRP